MNKINHADMVTVLAKPGEAILESLTPLDAHLLHMAVGVSGESGELLDAIKKATIYRKPIDRENVIEELGDLEFYMEGVRQALNITRQVTIDANIVKLGKRYEGFQYSDKAATVRADKAPAPRKFFGQQVAEEFPRNPAEISTAPAPVAIPAPTSGE